MTLKNANRRDILAILGVAAATTPTLASETFDGLNSPHAALAMPSQEVQEKAAQVLEAQARALRAGELTFHNVDIQSNVSFEDWMVHKVTWTLELAMGKDQQKIIAEEQEASKKVLKMREDSNARIKKMMENAQDEIATETRRTKQRIDEHREEIRAMLAERERVAEAELAQKLA